MKSPHTRRLIKTAFLQLLEQKPLREITVKDLMHSCDLNRNTFYYHFNDIPDLIEQIVTEESDRIIAAHPNINSFEACLQAAFDFALDNRTIILHIYDSTNRSIFERRLWKICQTTVSKYIHTITQNRPIPPEDLALTIDFLKCTSFGFVIDWINHGMPEDAKAKLAHFNRILKTQPPLLRF